MEMFQFFGAITLLAVAGVVMGIVNFRAASVPITQKNCHRSMMEDSEF